jgi:DNA-binding transcriptional LysR family regulator
LTLICWSPSTRCCKEASVSRAATRIHLSQPATSHALQRLRELLRDPLLVRTGPRMELTPRALALRAPLAQALDQVRGLFIPEAFDAAQSERQFRLMMPDLAVELLMPFLMEKVTRLAPNIRIEVVPWRGPAIFSAEFARTIDMVISIGNAFKGFHRQLLYTDSDALAVRCGHPVAVKLKRREVFLDARHVAVIIRGQNEDLIDTWLRAKGIERRIALVVPGYIEALHVAARTDPHRLRAAPPDRGVGKAIVACGDHTTARSRDRRAIHVLSDPRPDGPGLDLAAQADASDRARA